VRLSSKDSLLQLEVERVGDLPTAGLPGLVRGVLLGLGLDRGLAVSTQARVPFGTGLGSAGALAIALAAAAARATDASFPRAAAFAVHRHALEPGSRGARAVFGES
jgi:shikimate kinase